MGVTELAARNVRRSGLKYMMLETVKTAGLLSVALIAPNMMVAFQKLGMMPSRRQNEITKRAFLRLCQQGLLQLKGGKVYLTAKGETELRRLQVSNYKIRTPRRWDERWRIVIFDIPDKRRGLRKKVRTILKAAQFYPLQKSVWVHPYDCEEMLVLIKAEFRIGRQVLYMVVEALENDKEIRNHFNLRLQ